MKRDASCHCLPLEWEILWTLIREIKDFYSFRVFQEDNKCTRAFENIRSGSSGIVPLDLVQLVPPFYVHQETMFPMSRHTFSNYSASVVYEKVSISQRAWGILWQWPVGNGLASPFSKWVPHSEKVGGMDLNIQKMVVRCMVEHWNHLLEALGIR